MDVVLRVLKQYDNDSDDSSGNDRALEIMLYVLGPLLFLLVSYCCIDRNRLSAVIADLLAPIRGPRTHDVFVVHSGDQKTRAVELQKVLEGLGLSCFVDISSIRFGRAAPQRQMRAALRKCRHVVVIVSYRFLRDEAKRFAREEFKYAHDRMQFFEETLRNMVCSANTCTSFSLTISLWENITFFEHRITLTCYLN